MGACRCYAWVETVLSEGRSSAVKNRQIAALFDEIADILELRGENRFRIAAYRRGAQSLTSLAGEIEQIAAEGSLGEIPGIGKDLSAAIEEYLDSGSIRLLSELRAETPQILLDMLRIPGVGPKTAVVIHDELGIESLEELAAAAREHRLRGLPKIQAKTEENILRGIEFLEKSGGRIPLGEAYPIASRVVDALAVLPGVEDATFAGSLRRMRETVGDIDILVSSADPETVISSFAHLDGVDRILAEGKTKGSIITREHVQVDLRVVPPESYGAALNYFTGSKEHNIRLREIAQQRKMKLNEYGLFARRKRGADRRVAGGLEAEIYAKLGLSYIPPEIREDSGEIEAAARGELPELVTAADIKGDLHFHSDWSDGTASLEELVIAGRNKGYSYLVVSDHSKSLHIAHGLDEKRLRRQMEEIDRINSRTRGFRLLKGSEVDILPDGSLDLSDGILSLLDIVIVAVHSSFKMSRQRMTERVVRALANPHAHILAHPTGRLIGEREAYPIDMDEVIRAAAETGTAIEINAHPARLDLDSIHARRAAGAGVAIAIGTDSHNPLFEMDHMIYGLGTARRGWLMKSDVLNTLPARSLLSRLRKKRHRRP
jgi:DNA polymerase (family 10)